jgi:hypothetical protein
MTNTLSFVNSDVENLYRFLMSNGFRVGGESHPEPETVEVAAVPEPRRRGVLLRRHSVGFTAEPIRSSARHYRPRRER